MKGGHRGAHVRIDWAIAVVTVFKVVLWVAITVDASSLEGYESFVAAEAAYQSELCPRQYQAFSSLMVDGCPRRKLKLDRIKRQEEHFQPEPAFSVPRRPSISTVPTASFRCNTHEEYGYSDRDRGDDEPGGGVGTNALLTLIAVVCMLTPNPGLSKASRIDHYAYHPVTVLSLLLLLLPTPALASDMASTAPSTDADVELLDVSLIRTSTPPTAPTLWKTSSNQTPFIALVREADPSAELQISSTDTAPQTQLYSTISDWNWHWLNEDLKNVVIDLHDINHPKSKPENIEIHMHNGKCGAIDGKHQIQIGQLEASASKSGNKARVTVKLGGLQVPCMWPKNDISIKWYLISGKTGLTAVGSGKADATITLDYDLDHLPSSTSMPSSDCSAQIAIDSLTFTGDQSWLNKIPFLQSVLKSVVAKQVNPILCTSIIPLVDTNLTKVLKQGDALLAPFMHPPSPTPSPTLSPSPIDFTTIPAVATLSQMSTLLPPIISRFLNTLSNGTDVLMVPVGVVVHYSDMLADYTINIESLRVDNLEDLAYLRLAQPLGGANLRESFRVSNASFGLQLGMALKSKVSKLPQTLTYNATVDMSLLNLTVSVDHAVGSTLNGTEGLLLEQLQELGCLAPFVSSLDLTTLEVAYSGLPALRVLGDQPDFDGLADSVFDMALVLVSDALPSLLQGLLAVEVVPMINTMIDRFLTDLKDSGCEVPPRPSDEVVFDLTKIKAIETLSSFISTTVGDIDGPLSINRVMGMFTDDTGSIYAPGLVGSFTMDDDRAGKLVVSVYNLTLDGLMSFNEFNAITPAAHDALTLLKMNVGGSGPVGQPGGPLRVELVLRLDYTPHGGGLSTRKVVDYDGWVAMTDLKLLAGLSLGVEERIAWDITLGDLWGLLDRIMDKGVASTLNSMIIADDPLSCSIVTDIQELGIHSLAIHFGHVDFGMDNTTAEWIKHNAEPGSTWHAIVDAALDNHEGTYTAGHAGDEDPITEVLNDAMELFLPVGLALANSTIEADLKKVQAKCASQDAGSSKLVAILASCGAGVAGVALVGAAIQKTRQKKVSGDVMLTTSLVDRQPDRNVEVPVRNEVLAIAFHPSTDKVSRVVVLLMLVATVAFFLSGHTSVGAAVVLSASYGETKLESLTLFKFTLANSVKDMWKAKVYPLSLLIAICSGGWPYLKTILLAVCWFVPPTALGVTRRGTMLRLLDNLGKWSLIDAYVMVIFIVAFRFHLSNPPLEDVLPADMIAMDVHVKGEWGIYGFLCGAIIQLCATHVVIHFHREVQGAHELMREMTGGKKLSVMGNTFESHDNVFSFTKLGKAVVMMMVMTTIALIGYGMYTDTFTFEFKGAAGFAMDKLAGGREQSYSVLSLGQSVSAASDRVNVGVRYLQSTYMLFVIVIPLLYMAFLAALWVIPMTVAVQRGMMIAIEVLNAWGSLEIFVVSVISSLLEISQFAAFIVGDKCDQVDELLGDVARLLPGLYPPNEEDTCFDVTTVLENGCWILFGGAAIAIIVGQVMQSLCETSLGDRVRRNNRKWSQAQDAVQGGADESGICCLSCCKPMLRVLVSTGIVQLRNGHRAPQSGSSARITDTQIGRDLQASPLSP